MCMAGGGTNRCSDEASTTSVDLQMNTVGRPNTYPRGCSLSADVVDFVTLPPGGYVLQTVAAFCRCLVVARWVNDWWELLPRAMPTATIGLECRSCPLGPPFIGCQCAFIPLARWGPFLNGSLPRARVRENIGGSVSQAAVTHQL